VAVNFDNPNELLAALSLPTPEVMRERVMVLADLARAEIIRLAKERLHSSERDYVAGIQPVQMNGRTAMIVLTGVIPNMVERGWPAHDLRDTILRSAKAKTSKDGYKYMSIPFRINLPGATGRNGSVMGQPYENSSALDGRTLSSFQADLKKSAQGLEASVRKNGKTNWGGRLSAEEGGPILNPGRHVTGLYTGMVRIQKNYNQKSTQSRYGTFRTISTNPGSIRSDGHNQNWTHPGIVARNIFQVASEYVARMAPEVMKG
jgi:hypothetical protein